MSTFGGGFTLGTGAGTGTTPSLSLSMSTPTAPTSTAAQGTAPASIGISSLATPASAPSAPAYSAPSTTTTLGGTPGSTTNPLTTSQPPLNFRQLQDLVNKLTIEVEDQEKEFLEQATKINYWDKKVQANQEKISKLDDSMREIKKSHRDMENVLDSVKSSQKDFESVLLALEADLPTSVGDPDRLQMYSCAEQLDTDLQQMSEDLKEVIRHINENNKSLDPADPVSQILRILNEHTDSIQWMEDQCTTLKQTLDVVTNNAMNQ